tara:strand:+ start:499 stop:879 length:381 start_codon:yes stop_codon:yes gene_type:complete
MELFKEYIKEREGCETLIVDNGFLTAKVEIDETNNKYLFINDFFVSKKDRVKARKTATKLLALAKETAMRYKCLRICGIIWTNTNNATESLKANLYYGYKVVGTGNNCIYVEADLSEVKHPMTKKN